MGPYRRVSVALFLKAIYFAEGNACQLFFTNYYEKEIRKFFDEIS